MYTMEFYSAIKKDEMYRKMDGTGNYQIECGNLGSKRQKTICLSHVGILPLTVKSVSLGWQLDKGQESRKWSLGQEKKGAKRMSWGKQAIKKKGGYQRWKGQRDHMETCDLAS